MILLAYLLACPLVALGFLVVFRSESRLTASDLGLAVICGLTWPLLSIAIITAGFSRLVGWLAYGRDS